MKKTNLFIALSVIFIILIFSGCGSSIKTQTQDASVEPIAREVLVFTKTGGYRHKSIAKGVETLKALGAEDNYNVTQTEDSLAFNQSNLAKYKLIVFLNTTGNILAAPQQEAMEGFIKNGGSYLGIHAASDTEYEWPWYGKLVGGYFVSHPEQQEAAIMRVSDDASVAQFPERFVRFDEWYNFKDLNPDLTPTLMLDESSYEGGINGDYHPISWFHTMDGGKAYYIGGGHTIESYDEPLFREHIKRAVAGLLNK